MISGMGIDREFHRPRVDDDAVSGDEELWMPGAGRSGKLAKEAQKATTVARMFPIWFLIAMTFPSTGGSGDYSKGRVRLLNSRRGACK